MNYIYRKILFINSKKGLILPDLYGFLRLLSLLIPFIYIYVSENISNNYSEFILRLISLGIISSSTLSNEFYKNFYNSLINFSDDFIHQLNCYLSILLTQFILTIPLLLYFFKTNNYGEVISFILFLIYEKTYDETQRLIVFLEDSTKLYTLVIFFKRISFLFLLLFLSIFNFNNILFFSIFCIGLLLISFSNISFLTYRVILYLKRNYSNSSINFSFQIIKNLKFKNLNFKKLKFIYFPIKPFILNQIYTLVTIGPLFYLITIIPGNYFDGNLAYYLYIQKFITIPFLYFATIHWSIIRPKLRSFEPFIKLFLDFRFSIILLISLILLITAFSINFIFNNDSSTITLYSSITVVVSSSFLYLNEIIFWRTNLSNRTFFSVIFFIIWIFSFLIFESPISIASFYLFLKIIYYVFYILKLHNKKIKFIKK